MSGTGSEELLIWESDVVVAPDDRQPGEYDADLQKRLSDAKPAAPEDANQLLTYRHAGEHPFALRTTLADSFDAIHTIYLLEGSEGVKAFFKQNGLAARVVGGGRGPPILQQPETFIGAERVPAYRLLKQAEALIGDVARDWLKRIQPCAAAFGVERLNQARTQIESEATRYFAIENAPEALKLSFAFPFSRQRPDVKPMLDELRVCRTLWTAAVTARGAYNKAYAKRYVEIEQAVYPARITPSGADVDPPDWMVKQIAEEARNDASVKALEAPAREAERAVADYVMAATPQYPILWRLYKSVDVAASAEDVSRDAIGALQTAFQANVALEKDLAKDAALVWRFAPIVHQALGSARYVDRKGGAPAAQKTSGLSLTRFSIPWVAAEERLKSEGGLRLAQGLSIMVGAAQLGALGIGAAVGASILSGPVGITLLVADALFSVIDAVQEYLAYQTQLSAFNAVLDPSLALASEPDWISAAFVIATDIASLAFIR